MIKISYDKKADAAYIFLEHETGIKKTYPCDPQAVNGMINLDFNNEGRLVGVEVLGASKKLAKELLENADIKTS